MINGGRSELDSRQSLCWLVSDFLQQISSWMQQRSLKASPSLSSHRASGRRDLFFFFFFFFIHLWSCGLSQFYSFLPLKSTHFHSSLMSSVSHDAINNCGSWFVFGCVRHDQWASAWHYSCFAAVDSIHEWVSLNTNYHSRSLVHSFMFLLNLTSVPPHSSRVVNQLHVCRSSFSLYL